jgi:hypothetical protein
VVPAALAVLWRLERELRDKRRPVLSGAAAAAAAVAASGCPPAAKRCASGLGVLSLPSSSITYVHAQIDGHHQNLLSAMQAG